MGPGQSKALAQLRVGVSARASGPPEAQPRPHPELRPGVWATASSQGFGPRADGWEGSKEARSDEKKVYKEERSGSG